MNQITNTLIDCINKGLSGTIISSDGKAHRFTLIESIDGKTNTVSYVLNNDPNIHRINGSSIAEVKTDGITFSVARGEEIIHESASLRGKKQFDEAIELIEANLSSLDPDIKVNGL